MEQESLRDHATEAIAGHVRSGFCRIDLSKTEIYYRVSDHFPLWVEFGLTEAPA